jgi:lipopolysaccharide/colanic/teichoic acid biosynthesis glycosyltransferase
MLLGRSANFGAGRHRVCLATYPDRDLLCVPIRAKSVTPGKVALKRTMDVVASCCGLVVSLPLLPLVAVAIKLDSEGPVLFRQTRARELIPKRPGEQSLAPNCTEFTLYKFRTMCVDAEAKTGAVLAQKNDARVTRVGRFLRKSRLDELPQLWNVLRGDMSLVGPRPERPELLKDLALAIPFFEERMHDVKPGLTGPAQVHLGYTGAIPPDSELYRFKETLENPFRVEGAEGALADDLRAKLLWDLAYAASLERFSTFLSMELSVLFRTPLVMLKQSGH